MSKYIDADKLRNGVMQFVNEYGEIVGMFVTDFNILVERCRADVVKRVYRGRRPSDDLVEVKHGRWEQVGDNTYRCSVCGEISCCNSPFCSECGAKMDEVEE